MNEVSDLASALKELKSEFGDDIGGVGLKLPARPRLPSGLLAFDLATGGGIPLNAMTLVYGARNSGKTLLASCLIREWQKRYPDLPAVLVEPECDYDTDWAAKCGVDIDRLHIFRPETIEQTSDVMRAVLDADDAGLLVFDSVAAAASQAEIVRSAEKSAQPGGTSRTVNELCRNASNKFIRAHKLGKNCTMLWINQTRSKTGVMFGSPETIPGGMGQQFLAKLIIRIYGKAVIDPKVHKDIPSMQEVQGTVVRAKHQIGALQFKYNMVLKEHNGLKPGRSNDFPVFKQFASEMGLLAKGKGCWELADPGDGTVQEYGTQVELWEALRNNIPLWDRVRTAIISKVIE